jgi:probable HAF family extracellular repeat protein
MNPRKAACFVTVLLMACVPLALGQGTYAQIDYPGATTTFCTGINLAGDVVGAYYASGVEHGFLLSGGIFTTLDYPAATATFPEGINNSGQIVGQYLSTSVNGGFLYDEQIQTYTNIYRSGSTQTYASAINDAGTIVGVVLSNQNIAVGFELTGNTYRKILPNGFTNSGLGGINNLGVVLGVAYSQGTRTVPFEVNQQGQYQRIKIPARQPSPVGLNDNNAIVGYYRPTPQAAVGFIYQNNVLQSLTFPGGAQTVAYGINNAGVVSGYFNDASNVEHGFTWTPPADAAKK